MPVSAIKPLDNPKDFERLTKAFSQLLSSKESLKFLSYSLKEFKFELIEELTRNHINNGIDYFIYESDNIIEGILAIKKDDLTGFELFLLAVDCNKRKKGIGQLLINRCLKIASKENFKCVSSFVFADNKNMLRLLIKNDFIPASITHHSRADGIDLVQLKHYFK